MRTAAARRAVRPTSGAAPTAREQRAIGWRVAAGVVWLLAVLLAYYAVHKPVTAVDLAALRAPALHVAWQAGAVAGRILGELADLLVALWILLLAGALGHALWRALRLPTRGSAEARLVGTILGLGLLGLAAFGLGLLGLLTRPVAYALLGLPTLALAPGLVAQARWWLRVAHAWWHVGWAHGRIERVALLFSGATLLLVGVTALLPPTTAWDALSYHLVSARADATAGHIVLDPGNPQVYQPQLMEMLYALTLLMRGGDGAAAPLHAGCGIVAVALVGLWGWRAFGPRAALRASTLALGMPVVATLAGWPYVDLTLAAAGLAALAALPRWQLARRAGARGAAWGWLVAGALACGVALDVKYTGIYTLGALAALVALVAWREPPSPDLGRAGASPSAGAEPGAWDAPISSPSPRHRAAPAPRWRAALGPPLVFLAIALALGSVWPMRNLLVTGDPFFPYHLGTLFPSGPSWDLGRTAFVQGHGWGVSALWRAPLVPLEAMLLGVQGSSEFDATLGPLLLLLLPLGLLLLRRVPRAQSAAEQPVAPTEPQSSVASLRRYLFWALGFAALLSIIWGEELARSGVAMQTRLFLALFLVLGGPAAVVWLRLESLRVPAVALNRLAGAAVALCLGLTLLGQAVQTLSVDNLAVLVGAQSREAYLAQQLDPYAAAMRRLDGLGPRARVLLLWEPRSYLTHARVEPDPFLDNFNALYRHCGAASAIARCLRAAGFTHVLLYQEGLHLLRGQPGGKDPPAELATLDAFLLTLPVIYRDATPLVPRGGTGWYVLYALENTP